MVGGGAPPLGSIERRVDGWWFSMDKVVRRDSPIAAAAATRSLSPLSVLAYHLVLLLFLLCTLSIWQVSNSNTSSNSIQIKTLTNPFHKKSHHHQTPINSIQKNPAHKYPNFFLLVNQKSKVLTKRIALLSFRIVDSSKTENKP